MIEENSLLLAPLTLEHVNPMVEAANESVKEVFPWLPWCREGFSFVDSEKWIIEQIAAWKNGKAFEFAILNADGNYLGGIGINNINTEHNFANVGYWVRSSVAQRGIATEAVNSAVKWAYQNTSLERLELVIAVSNHASQRVAAKTGAIREGVARSRLVLHDQYHDAVMYSFIRPHVPHLLNLNEFP